MVCLTTGLEIALWILLQLISACISFDSFFKELLRLKSSENCYQLFTMIKQNQSSKDIKSNTFKIIFYQQQYNEEKQWSADLNIGFSGRSTGLGGGNLPKS